MKKLPLFIVVAALAGSTVSSHAFLDSLIGSGGTKTEDNDSDLGLAEYKGIKHAIGVQEFSNASGFFSSLSLGSNLSVMLESALIDSGRFVVVERGALGSIIKEQDLVTAGRATGGKKVAQTGKLRSAKYIATGAITAAEQNTAGNSGGLSFKGIRVGASGGKATLTAIIKIVDSTTGEILAKKSITGTAGKRGLSLGYSGSNLGGLRGDVAGFAKTPMGEAAQDVIDEAVKYLSTEMEDYKLDATVVSVTGDGQVIINRGEQYGVGPGQSFVVSTEGEELIDPDSGEILDRIEGEVVGEIEVTKVKEKIAYCKVIDGDAPKRGDVVTAK
jgi:curli biogenesis system outer membrane secretion channel CsgG